MASLRVWSFSSSLSAGVILFASVLPCLGQAPVPPVGSQAASELAETNAALVGPWEFTLGGRIGVPTGHLKVGEFPTGSAAAGGGGTPGTLLQLRGLGIDVSEAVEGSAAFHITPRDAVRAGLLYYFLDGSTTVNGPSVVYNGAVFGEGPLRTNANFYRFSLSYERTLFSRSSGEEVIASAGLTWVSLNPTLSGNLETKRDESEDFYAQELPVPIFGVRWDLPLGPHLLLRSSVSGGALPKVNSLRQEGGTVYLQQSHADVDIGLMYLIGHHAEVGLGYHFTYFFQHETSHEDNNLFELIDNSAQVRFTLRF
jgi:hypothetical protein